MLRIRPINRASLFARMLSTAAMTTALFAFSALAGCSPSAKPEAAKTDAAPTEAVSDGEATVKGVSQVTVAAASARRMREVVELLGSTEPEPNASTTVATQVAGRIRRLSVREGDAVQAGQVVAELESGDTAEQLAGATLAVTQEKLAVAVAQRQAGSALLAARAQVRKTSDDLRSLIASNESALTTAKAALATSQRDLERVKAGARPQEIAVARAALAESDALRQNAQTQAQRTKRLFDQEVVSKRQVDESQSAVRVAEAQYQAAAERLRLIEEGSRKEEVAVAQARVKEAESALHTAETLRLGEAGKRDDLATATAQVENAEAALQQAKAGQQNVRQKELLRQGVAVRNGFLRVTTPIAGIVLRRVANEGDTVQPGSVLLEIGKPGRLRFRVGIPTIRIAELRVGMPANVFFDSLAGKSFAARVQRVGEASDGSGNGTAWLSLPGAEAGRLRSGLSGKARITTQDRKVGMAVPLAALIEEENNDVVVIVGADNIAHRKKVKTGIRDGDWVEITQGINAGQRVVTLGPYEVEEGGSVKVVEAGKENAPVESKP